MDSPYRPGFGARPAVFVGRDAQVARARTVLNRVINTGAPAPSMLVLVGPRGLGKTVMLDVIADVAAERGFVTVQIAMDNVSDAPQLLAGRLAIAAEPLGRSGGREAWSAIRRRLAQLSIKINAGVLTISSPPAANDTASWSVSMREHLTALLTTTAELAAHAGRHGLVVLLDELQQARHGDLVVVTNALQDALRGAGVPLAAFGAGLPDTPERVMEASSFTERFDFRPLHRLTREEAERALLEPALALGVTWQLDAAEAVLDAAGGSPYLIQLFGDEVWQLADPEPEDELTTTHTQAALREANDRLGNGMFRGRWAKTSPTERDFLTALAQTANRSGESASRDYTAVLDRTTQQLSSVRQILIDKGLIEAAGHGRLRFTIPGFGDYVLLQAIGNA